MGVIVRQKEKVKGAPYWVFISHKGGRTSKCIGSKDAAMAVAKRIELRLAVGDYEFDDQNKLDQDKKKEKYFNEYAKVWIENVVPTICKPSTAEDYVQILAKHILPVFGELEISKITRGIVKDFLLGQLQKGYATSTVIHMKNVVSGILNKAMDDEDIVVNPAQQLGRIFTSKDKSETINPLTQEELKHFLDVAREFFPENYGP